MPTQEPSFAPPATRDGQRTAAAAGGAHARQRVRGIGGRLRPYGDVRAGFEPWRRIALAAWAELEDRRSVH